MATYFINAENTGLDSDDKLELMAELMRVYGYDVVAIDCWGLVNEVECPVSEKEWEYFIAEADDLGE